MIKRDDAIVGEHCCAARQWRVETGRRNNHPCSGGSPTLPAISRSNKNVENATIQCYCYDDCRRTVYQCKRLNDLLGKFWGEVRAKMVPKNLTKIFGEGE
jgi:hypothetical protein